MHDINIKLDLCVAKYYDDASREDYFKPNVF